MPCYKLWTLTDEWIEHYFESADDADALEAAKKIIATHPECTEAELARYIERWEMKMSQVGPKKPDPAKDEPALSIVSAS